MCARGKACFCLSERKGDGGFLLCRGFLLSDVYVCAGMGMNEWAGATTMICFRHGDTARLMLAICDMIAKAIMRCVFLSRDRYRDFLMWGYNHLVR